MLHDYANLNTIDLAKNLLQLCWEAGVRGIVCMCWVSGWVDSGIKVINLNFYSKEMVNILVKIQMWKLKELKVLVSGELEFGVCGGLKIGLQIL